MKMKKMKTERESAGDFFNCLYSLLYLNDINDN